MPIPTPRSLAQRLAGRLEPTRKRFLRQFWGQLLARTIFQLGHDDAGDMAASLAYYALLSIFPLTIGVIAVLGFLIPSEMVQQRLFAFFQEHLPTSVGLLEDNITSIVELRGTLGILSLIGLFWSGGAIFGSIGRAMDRAWGVQEHPSFFVANLRQMLLSLGSAFLFFLSLALTAAAALVPSANLPFGVTTTAISAQVLSFLLVFSMTLLIYKFMPNTRVAWREVWQGALLAAVLFAALRGGFSLYLTQFANYQLVYGSIASVIALMVWIYASAFVLILGIEFSSEYTKMKRSGWTPDDGSA